MLWRDNSNPDGWHCRFQPPPLKGRSAPPRVPLFSFRGLAKVALLWPSAHAQREEECEKRQDASGDAPEGERERKKPKTVRCADKRLAALLRRAEEDVVSLRRQTIWWKHLAPALFNSFWPSDCCLISRYIYDYIDARSGGAGEGGAVLGRPSGKRVATRNGGKRLKIMRWT